MTFIVSGRYDPGTSISEDITTESDRVLFLQSIAQSMLLKARIKLNIKRLYAADAVAVKDLLSIATLLYKATRTTTDADDDVRHSNKHQHSACTVFTTHFSARITCLAFLELLTYLTPSLQELWEARSHKLALQCMMLCNKSLN